MEGFIVCSWPVLGLELTVNAAQLALILGIALRLSRWELTDSLREDGEE